MLHATHESFDSTEFSEPAPKIEAAFQDDLDAIIPNFTADYESGKLKCSCCKEPLKNDGIHSVEIKDDGYEWICQKIECIFTSLENNNFRS